MRDRYLAARGVSEAAKDAPVESSATSTTR